MERPDLFLPDGGWSTCEFDRYLERFEPSSHAGRQAWERRQVWTAGDEAQLVVELSALARTIDACRERPEAAARARAALAGLPPLEAAAREGGPALLFALKKAAIAGERLTRAVEALSLEGIPGGGAPPAVDGLLDLLDPAGRRDEAFYVYDDYSPELAGLRHELRGLTAERERLAGDLATGAAARLGVARVPEDGLAVDHRDRELLERARRDPGLSLRQSGDRQSLFVLKPSEELRQLDERLAGRIERERELEERLLADLAVRAAPFRPQVERLVAWAARIDLLLARAALAERDGCCVPELAGPDEAPLSVRDGVHPPLRERTVARGIAYTPVTIGLCRGGQVLTGSNMSGKSFALRTLGLLQGLFQLGFAVPAARFRAAPVARICITPPLTEAARDGLSRFGGEMRFLSAALERPGRPALLLLDELAAGTDPAAALALQRAVLAAAAGRSGALLLATHLRAVATIPGVPAFTTGGLVRSRLDRYRHAFRGGRGRIEDIARCLDFAIYPAGDGRAGLDDPLAVAGLFGVDREILDRARLLLEQEDGC